MKIQIALIIQLLQKYYKILQKFNYWFMMVD